LQRKETKTYSQPKLPHLLHKLA